MKRPHEKFAITLERLMRLMCQRFSSIERVDSGIDAVWRRLEAELEAEVGDAPAEYSSESVATRRLQKRRKTLFMLEFAGAAAIVFAFFAILLTTLRPSAAP